MCNKAVIRIYYSHLSLPCDRIDGLSLKSRYNVYTCVYFWLLNPHYEKWTLPQYDYDLNIQTLLSALIDRYPFAQTSYRNSYGISLHMYINTRDTLVRLVQKWVKRIAFEFNTEKGL